MAGKRPMVTAWLRRRGQVQARWRCDLKLRASSVRVPRSPGVTEPAEPVPLQLAANPSLRTMAFRVGQQTREALNTATTAQDWNTLFLASPEFMRR